MEQCPFHREPVGRWENDEARPVVEVSILCFLECFYTVGLCWKDIGAQFTEYLTTVLQSSYDKCQSCDRLTILVQFTKHLTKVSCVRFTCRIARSCEIVLN